jgi:hypothetical protein
LAATVDALQAILVKLEALANGHRADFESERDRVSRLMAELLRATARLLTASQKFADPGTWQRLAGSRHHAVILIASVAAAHTRSPVGVNSAVSATTEPLPLCLRQPTDHCIAAKQREGPRAVMAPFRHIEWLM